MSAAFSSSGASIAAMKQDDLIKRVRALAMKIDRTASGGALLASLGTKPHPRVPSLQRELRLVSRVRARRNAYSKAMPCLITPVSVAFVPVPLQGMTMSCQVIDCRPARKTWSVEGS